MGVYVLFVANDFIAKNKRKTTCGWDCAEAHRKEQNKAWRNKNKK